MSKLPRQMASSLLLLSVLSPSVMVLEQEAYSRPLASFSSEISEVAARSANKSFRRWAGFFRSIRKKASGRLISAGAKSILQNFGIDPSMWDLIREISKKPELVNDLHEHYPENKVLTAAKDAYRKYYHTRCSKYDKLETIFHLYRLPESLTNDGEVTQLEVCVALHNIHVVLIMAALKKVPKTVPFAY